MSAECLTSPVFFAAPNDLLGWTHGAVAAHIPETSRSTRFPASVDGMLVLRTQGSVFRTGQKTPLPELALIGPSATPLSYTHRGAVDTYGLLLAPHTVSFLGRRCNGEMAGQDHDLQILNPIATQRLYQNWHLQQTDLERCQAMLEWLRYLTQTQAEEAERWSALAHLPQLLMEGNAAACDELGLGTRQLERISQLHLNMSPHRARTILRMRAALWSAMGSDTRPRGPDLALSHGYFDQSHMGRDLKRLAGMPFAQALAASQGRDSSGWPLNVGKQLVRSQAPGAGPGTAAARTPTQPRSTSAHRATGEGGGARKVPRH